MPDERRVPLFELEPRYGCSPEESLHLCSSLWRKYRWTTCAPEPKSHLRSNGDPGAQRLRQGGIVRFKQIRNATVIIEFGGKKFLVDPMLSEKGGLAI